MGEVERCREQAPGTSTGGQALDAIAFNQAAENMVPGMRVHAVYRLDVNEYRGNRTLQLIVEHLAPVSA